MHRKIIIAMSNYSGVLLTSEIPTSYTLNTVIGDIISFNRKEINLYGAFWEWFNEAGHTSYDFLMKLTHPEFPEVPEGEQIPIYRLPEAKKRFPFLFVDTNPILYRKYQGERSV